jgi:hypothetical protein
LSLGGSSLADVISLRAIHAGKLELLWGVVNVRRLLTAVVRAHSHLAEVPLRLEVDDAVPQKIIGDAMRLQQILANGLVNATKVRGMLLWHAALCCCQWSACLSVCVPNSARKPLDLSRAASVLSAVRSL